MRSLFVRIHKHRCTSMPAKSADCSGCQRISRPGWEMRVGLKTLRLVSPPRLLSSTPCGPRETRSDSHFPRKLPGPFPPNSHAMRSQRSGDETGQSDNLRLEGEASRKRSLDAAIREAASGNPMRNCGRDWKSFEYRPLDAESTVAYAPEPGHVGGSEQRGFRGGRATTLPTPLPDVSKKTCTIPDALAAQRGVLARALSKRGGSRAAGYEAWPSAERTAATTWSRS